MTALEFLNEYQKDKIILQSFIEEGPAFYGSAQGAMYITDVMVEFAQYHVKKALEAALEDIPYGGSDPISFEDVKDIGDSYPLTNIKSY